MILARPSLRSNASFLYTCWLIGVIANTFTITVNSCDLGHVFRPVKLELLFKSNFGAHRVVAIVFSSLRLLLKCGSSFYVHSSSAQIVTRDGRIWYYDGLALVNANLNVRVQPTLEEVGSIRVRCRPDLQSCRGGRSTAAIYAKL